MGGVIEVEFLVGDKFRRSRVSSSLCPAVSFSLKLLEDLNRAGGGAIHQTTPQEKLRTKLPAVLMGTGGRRF